MNTNTSTPNNDELTFFKSKYHNLGHAIGIKVNNLEMNLFIDVEKEIQKIEVFLDSKKKWYPFGAYYNIDLNLVKVNNVLHFEVDYESGRKIRVPIEWQKFKKDFQFFSKN